MARSLTVTHDEKPSTNPLFTLFFVLAATWLLLSGLALSSADSSAASESQSDAALDAE